MARPRTPVAVAKATGAAVKNPARMAGRKSPKADALGAPSAHLGLFEKRAFERFRRELPWLKESHRLLVEVASIYRGKVLTPGWNVELKTLQELRRCLGQLGATPADESKIVMENGDDEDEEDGLFAQPVAGLRPN